MKYLYYPGCSVKSTNRAYEESLLAVFNHSSIPLEEINDWNCCGATAYMAVNEIRAFALAARNFGLAEQQAGYPGTDSLNIVVPCSGCYLVLYKTKEYLNIHPHLKEKIQAGLREIGLKYTSNIAIRHPLDVVVNDIGLETLAQFVQQPLNGYKIACYYGCQIVRPFEAFESARNPSILENMVTALGAEAVDWPLKTRCCGGTLMGTIHEVGLRLSHILLKEAQKHGANLIITTCPLCQINLECYQSHMNRIYAEKISIPVIFFTQLIGMAFGISSRQLGINRLFVSPLRARQNIEGGSYVRV
ncbi:CoB--CoM heterodisulfide reductase iron-sulfur subunit B family protein [candidate division CSSED10-310 bacterium]|uniref:CoB--CoM heterodisulfide reductase iron-sulfur subunit B family protein n=1 Tax=candidate division CSSED10-310 bacterium TaxID=2855610 RepID=A0ABV6YT09_UNCC1